MNKVIPIINIIRRIQITPIVANKIPKTFNKNKKINKKNRITVKNKINGNKNGEVIIKLKSVIVNKSNKIQIFVRFLKIKFNIIYYIKKIIFYYYNLFS